MILLCNYKFFIKMCHVYIQYPLFLVQFQIFSALMPMNIYCNKEKLVVEYMRIKRRIPRLASGFH